MRVPCSLVAVPLLAGCAAGLHVFTLDHVPLSAAAGACLAVLAGGAALAGAARDGTACVLVGSFLAGLSLGSSGARQAYSPPLLEWFRTGPARDGGPVVLEGVLREDAAPGPTGVALALDVRLAAAAGESIEAVGPRRGGVRLTVSGTLALARAGEWRGGRTVRVTAILREPVVYLNPGVPDDRPGLARRGIVLVGTVKSAALVDVVAPGSPVAEAAAACRAWVRRAVAAAVGTWSARSGGIATAILLGDRTGLDADDERRLQEAGTYHVIAISGGNIAILTAILVVSLRTLRVPSRAAAGAAMLLLVCYWHVAAPSSSVDRAITAALVYLAGRLLDQTGPAINVLAAVAVLAVARSPVAILDPGFILSFGATLGILVGVPRLTRRLRDGSRIVRAAAALLAATIAAEVVLAPVSASLFSRMTIAGLILNFAAIPLMSVVQAASLLVLILSAAAERAAHVCGYLVHLAAAGLIDSARLVDVVPWLSREVLPPAGWALVCYYAGVVAALGAARHARAGLAVAAAAMLAILSGARVTARDVLWAQAPGTLRIVVFDVGQGDATALLLPGGRALLVDAGGFPIPALDDADSSAPRFDIGARVVAPALRASGVRRLDALVITHADPDHIGGAPAILRRFRPRAIWEGVPVPPHRGLIALAANADRLGAEWRTLQAGDRLRYGGVQVTVLHPPPPDWERQRVRNEDSVVLQIRYGDVSIVLPGDIGREAEPMALAHVTPAAITVLKAAHHGSATSSTPAFLAALDPDAVIFSAGRRNRFGHPAPAVVSRFRRLGAAAFSTAEDGAVIVDTDGRSVEIRGWTGRRYDVRAPDREQ